MKTLKTFLLLIVFSFKAYTQAVTLTPQGNTSSSFALMTTSDVSQTGTPTVAQLIYNTNASITGTDANGIGYYFWNGSNWKSLDANIPQSTIIFSEMHPNQTLINAGFSMIGTTQISTPALDVWRKISTINAPIKTTYRSFFEKNYQNKFYFFGEANKNRGIYDPEIDTWTLMDSVVIVTDPNIDRNLYFTKDRALELFRYPPDSTVAWVFNPIQNSWESLAVPSKISGISNSSYYGNNYSNYIIVNMQDDTQKICDLITNTCTNISTINAPSLNNGNFRFITLPTKIIVITSDFSNYQSYIYDISLNQWNQTNSTNAPTGTQWYFSELKTDSTITFVKSNFNSSYDTTTMVFKKYNFSQNMWTDELVPLVKSTIYSTIPKYIGKKLDKLYFHVGKDLQEYDVTQSKWRLIENPNETPNGRTSFANMYMFNNKIFKLGGINRGPVIPFYDDGFIYDLETENWSYIPAVLSQEVKLRNQSPYEVRSTFVINDKYLLSYFNRYVGVDGVTDSDALIRLKVNQSAIMQLSGTTNQATQKLMYLYKKL